MKMTEENRTIDEHRLNWNRRERSDIGFSRTSLDSCSMLPHLLLTVIVSMYVKF